MKKNAAEIKVKIISISEKIKSFFVRHREVSGITVIEFVLILVINLIPYFGVNIVCIE